MYKNNNYLCSYPAHWQNVYDTALGFEDFWVACRLFYTKTNGMERKAFMKCQTVCVVLTGCGYTLSCEYQKTETTQAVVDIVKTVFVMLPQLNNVSSIKHCRISK